MHRIRAAPPLGAFFFGSYQGTRNQGREIHAKAVAGKTRHKSKKSPAATRRSKKTSAGTHRRTSQPPRAATRHGVSVAKAPLRARKPDEGVIPGMTNKKATQRHGFKTSEF